jgi:hypothetical protein
VPGWPQEETTEYSPMQHTEQVQQQQQQQRPGGDTPEERPAENPPEPILNRISGAGSADFDWGE